MSPDPSKVRKWAALIEKRCRVEQQVGLPDPQIGCSVHRQPIAACAAWIISESMDALPAVLDAWAEEGGEALFYKRKAADLAALMGSDPPIFEVLSPQEQTAFRSEFRKQVGIRSTNTQ